LRHKGLMAAPHSETQQIERLIPLADALVCIDRLVAPAAPRRVAVGAALGHVVAVPDMAVATVRPAAAIALRGGFAARAEAALHASSYAPAIFEAVAIEVGDPLPAGADAVAPAEAAELRDKTLHVTAPLASGDGVLPAGADATPGEPLLRDA